MKGSRGNKRVRRIGEKDSPENADPAPLRSEVYKEAEKPDRIKKRKPRSGKKRKRKQAIVAVSLTFLFAAGTVLGIRYYRNTVSGEDVTYELGPFTDGEKFEPGDPSTWKGPTTLQIARIFAETGSYEERLKLLRNPGEDAELMRTFFQEGPGAGEKVIGILQGDAESSNFLSFDRFQVKFENGKSRLLCVVTTEEGGTVDFRSYARYCSESWQDLLGGAKTEAAEVRVFIKPTFAYLYGYADDAKWTSYLATSPDLEDPMYFYVERDSEAADELAAITKAGNLIATLAIRSTGDSHRHRQFEVTKVHCGGWVK